MRCLCQHPDTQAWQKRSTLREASAIRQQREQRDLARDNREMRSRLDALMTANGARRFLNDAYSNRWGRTIKQIAERDAAATAAAEKLADDVCRPRHTGPK